MEELFDTDDVIEYVAGALDDPNVVYFWQEQQGEDELSKIDESLREYLQCFPFKGVSKNLIRDEVLKVCGGLTFLEDLVDGIWVNIPSNLRGE